VEVATSAAAIWSIPEALWPLLLLLRLHACITFHGVTSQA